MLLFALYVNIKNIFIYKSTMTKHIFIYKSTMTKHNLYIFLNTIVHSYSLNTVHNKSMKVK